MRQISFKFSVAAWMVGPAQFLETRILPQNLFLLENLSKQKKLKTGGASKLDWTEPKFLFLKARTSWGPGSTLPKFLCQDLLGPRPTKEELAFGAMNVRDLPSTPEHLPAWVSSARGPLAPRVSLSRLLSVIVLKVFWVTISNRTC